MSAVRRYALAKIAAATEGFFSELFAGGPPAGSLARAISKFKETYTMKMTTSMYLAGETVMS